MQNNFISFLLKIIEQYKDSISIGIWVSEEKEALACIRYIVKFSSFGELNDKKFSVSSKSIKFKNGSKIEILNTSMKNIDKGRRYDISLYSIDIDIDYVNRNICPISILVSPCCMCLEDI